MTDTSRLATKRRASLALFDTVKQIDTITAPAYLTPAQRTDFAMAQRFLQAYTGSLGTFNSYRRDVGLLLQWTWHIADKVLVDVKRDDMEAFIRFCRKPPSAWIGIKKAPRFRVKDGTRQPNPEWRTFVVTVSKSAFKKGMSPDQDCVR
ncbi:MAG: hypothetical protein HKN85_12215, partial [Gammaproteobacteria bacterium]|nr:hypothetical protein [Gammaproteobacteria bacterium]